MPLLNRSGVHVSHVEYFVARATVPRDVQLCAMRFRATARSRTNALLVPFPSDAPAAERFDVVRVGDLKDGYGELFDDLERNALPDADDDDSAVDREDVRTEDLSARNQSTPSSSSSLTCARKVAVRVCADWSQLLLFREKGFRLSKTLKPILQHYYSDGYAFIVCFLEFTPDVTELVELTFTFPISHENDDALYVPALTRPSLPLPTFNFVVYSVNTGRSAGVSTDEAARRLYRKLSAVVHSDAEHNALLTAAKRHELRTALLPVRLVDIVELRRLKVRGKQRNEDLLLELDEATQQYFKALRALKEPGSVVANVERLLEKCLSHNAQHVAALTLLANLLQQDDARTDEAEKKFRLLLRANPVRADSLQNFALFVEMKMKDHDTAEVLYTRALTIEPSNPRVLANFAVFLKNVRHDYDFADSLYKRAIQAAPTSANTIANYALFLYSVRNDVLKADQLFRLAISLEERAAASHANGGDVSSTSLLDGHSSGVVFWKRRYESFLESLQRSGRLESLLNTQLPPLAVPRTADGERLEKLNRKRAEEQKQRDLERAALERAARRTAQRVPAVVISCVRALVFGWHDVSASDACVCLQRDDIHVPQLEADETASDDAQADNAAVACHCGGNSGEIVSSVLFRRAKDAMLESTYERVLHSVQTDEPNDAVGNDEEFERQAIGNATSQSGAPGARDCLIRALNLLRGRESRLTTRCYHAMAALLTAALLAAYSQDAYAQCRDLMHMANTYRLDDMGAADEFQDDDSDSSSKSSITTSLEASEEDGGMRMSASSTTVSVAPQPSLHNGHAARRDAALRTSRLVLTCRSLTLLRVLRSSANQVWSNRTFWEAALNDELRTQQLRQSNNDDAVTKNDVFDSSEALNEGDARTTALVLGQVASFATNMVHLDCDFDFIADFVDKQCVVYNLPTATRDELLQHAATASLVETMRDVSFSNPTRE